MSKNAMTGLEIDLHVEDGSWQKHMRGITQHGYITRVGNIPNGTAAGLPVFQLMATLDDGSTVFVETTWALMRGALIVLNERWQQDQS